jgi:hypothetical protein
MVAIWKLNVGLVWFWYVLCIVCMLIGMCLSYLGGMLAALSAALLCCAVTLSIALRCCAMSRGGGGGCGGGN